MKKYIFLFFALLAGMISCSKSDEPSGGEKTEATKRSALIYAVNGNNLSSNMALNIRQIQEAMSGLPKGKYELYLYQAIAKEKAGLCKIVSGKDARLDTLKVYDRSTFATDPVRIKEIMNDYKSLSAVDDRILFLWGHGMAWTPYFSDHGATRASDEAIVDMPMITSFGGDNNSSDWADIHELKEAIPSGLFSTIWFDCCYMSNIETVYELREKCQTMIAYPTEIAANGLPYHKILPKIFADKPNYFSAADALYEYYNMSSICVTVAVMDMSKIEDVAAVAKKIYASGENRPAVEGLQDYSRARSARYYDFGQFARETAELNNASELVKDFNRAMDNFVVYSHATALDFNRRPIKKENFSGVSTHYYKGLDTKEENYYRGLDWYKAVYE